MTNPNEDFTLAALCAIGAEKICANEIRKLNEHTRQFRILECGFGRVTFQSSLEGIYRAIFALRTADRLLLRCAYFDAPDFDALFEGARNAELERFIPPRAAIAIDKVRTSLSKLEAETSVQAVVHKAAADRLCAAFKTARLPEPGSGGPCFNFRVYLKKNRAELLLDLSGEPLFKRGYRSAGGGIAPLRETSAAALLFTAGWRRKHPLYDPFCGSGTIAIEAALFACNIAPNLNRPFALDGLAIANKALAQRVREELRENEDLSAPFDIQGSDSDSGAIRIARENARRAFEGSGLAPELLPLFNTVPVETARTFKDGRGFIVTNPPYGKRLGTLEEAERGYQKMAVLKKNFPGWKIVVISDNTGFESFFGQQCDICTGLTNGMDKTYIYQFDNISKMSIPDGRAPAEQAERNTAKEEPQKERGEKPPRQERQRRAGKPEQKKQYVW